MLRLNLYISYHHIIANVIDLILLILTNMLVLFPIHLT